jgi:hypothetical protein
VETIARIRREHFVKGKTIKEIARDLKVSRNTVRKVLRSGETSFEYECAVQPRPITVTPCSRMCSHYLVDPVACTPASGWEKGQVANQVGLVRERFFTPRLRFKTLDELNAWLLDKCIAYAKEHRHPELTEQTVWEVFEAERLANSFSSRSRCRLTLPWRNLLGRLSRKRQPGTRISICSSSHRRRAQTHA